MDFAIPLITNVKNAKLLAEALVRKLPLDVSNVDSKSSYLTHVFPGLVNVAAFVPKITAASGDDSFSQATQAALCAGFTTSLILPHGVDGSITDVKSLQDVQNIAASNACCHYALNVATANGQALPLDDEFKPDVKALFIAFHEPAGPPEISAVAAHFASWPTEKMIVTDARGSNLASVLLLASLHNRSVHITDVRSKEDLCLISLSKARNLKVTCDVSVYTLSFTRDQYPQSTILPSNEDQAVFWKNLDAIDAFSVGNLPYYLAVEQGQKGSAWSGVEETIPLLLNAVIAGRITLQDIRTRVHDNPIRIFGLPEQANTHVEVVLGRRSQFVSRDGRWSPLDKTTVVGSLHRVVMHGKTLFLDGTPSPAAIGKDVSGAAISRPVGESRAVVVPVVKPEFVPSHAPVKNIDVHAPAHPAPGPLGAIIPTLSHSPHPAFHRRHILTVKQFSQRDMYDLFSLAHEMRLQVERSGTLDILKGRVLCNLFYEPSTRTSASFDAAMKRCGGEVIHVNVDTSSVQKGETLADTVRTIACYADAIVIRHPDVGSAQLAAKFSPVPVLNAGDGIGEHPTQVRKSAVGFHTAGSSDPRRHYWTCTQFDLSSEQSMDAQSPYSAT